MAQDRPTMEELVVAVEEFLRQEVMPRLDGRPAFHARVAANVLGIVGRELRTGSELDVEERRRLLELLSSSHPAPEGLTERSTKDLERELCRRIRSGTIDEADPALRQHLWATALAKLSVDNPKYRAYRRALEERERGD